jgi:hypothetical protein
MALTRSQPEPIWLVMEPEQCSEADHERARQIRDRATGTVIFFVVVPGWLAILVAAAFGLPLAPVVWPVTVLGFAAYVRWARSNLTDLPPVPKWEQRAMNIKLAAIALVVTAFGALTSGLT